MGRLNRRQFLQKGSLAVAAAGVATAVPGAVAALDDATPALAPDTSTAVEGAVPTMSEPLVARVTNATTGEIQMFFGTNSTKVTDPGLAARLLRAAQ
jgi:hypothetical protein